MLRFSMSNNTNSMFIIPVGGQISDYYYSTACKVNKIRNTSRMSLLQDSMWQQSTYPTVSIIDPLSEGLVTPPLGVEKLSPRFNFFDNMFSCITWLKLYVCRWLRAR